VIYLVMNGHKVIILEPGNIEAIQAGRLALTTDHSVSVAYAPDHVWLQQEMLKIGGDKLQPADVTRLLKEGLGRLPVTTRPYHPTWDAATTKEGKA
jgi:hypothetical protein